MGQEGRGGEVRGWDRRGGRVRQGRDCGCDMDVILILYGRYMDVLWMRRGCDMDVNVRHVCMKSPCTTPWPKRVRVFMCSVSHATYVISHMARDEPEARACIAAIGTVFWACVRCISSLTCCTTSSSGTSSIPCKRHIAAVRPCKCSHTHTACCALLQ